MRYILFLFCVSYLLSACSTEVDTTNLSKDYLMDKWQINNQTIHFYDDTSAILLSVLKDESVDTMLIYYNFQPDSSPVQLDMQVYEGSLKGMNLFGIIDPVSQDTFLMTSKMGFEGQAHKYRPQHFDSTKVVTYVRLK